MDHSHFRGLTSISVGKWRFKKQKQNYNVGQLYVFRESYSVFMVRISGLYPLTPIFNDQELQEKSIQVSKNKYFKHPSFSDSGCNGKSLEVSIALFLEPPCPALVLPSFAHFWLKGVYLLSVPSFLSFSSFPVP